ncbi:MAG: CARDB domain-containing protein [bacterium]
MKKTTLLSTLILLTLSCLAYAQQKATPVAKIRIENGKIVSFEKLGSTPSLEQKQKTGSTQLVHGTQPEETHNYQDKNLQQNNGSMSGTSLTQSNTAVSGGSINKSAMMYEPDLLVTGVNVTNANPANLTYDITIKNDGRVNLNTTFHNYVYLSTDTQIGSGGDIKIDDWVIQSNPYTFFTAGTSKNSGNRTVNVKGKPPGNYFVGVVADAEGDITESDEQNNTGYDDTPKVSIIAEPDLVVTQLSLNSIEKNSLTLTISCKIKNQGQKSVDFGESGDPDPDYLTLGFYLSSDESISLNDYLYGTRLLDGTLAPGETRTCNNYKVPAENKEIPQGDYYLGLYVDSDCEYSESSETNNSSLADGPMVTVPEPIPDLTWGVPSTIIEYRYDEIDNPERTLYNIGWADINTPFFCRIMLSEDEISDDSDSLLYENEYSHLEFNRSFFVGNRNIPTHDIPAGAYYLIYEADTANTITELSENNNTMVSEPFEIVHLQVQNPNGGEIWVKEHPYTIQWTTQGTIPSVHITLYIDDNPQEVIATDIPNTGIFEYTPPNSLSDGTTYKIRVQDKDRRTSDLSDNQFTIQTSYPNTYQPDLIVTDVNISNADPASLSYDITIKNEGRVNLNTTFHNYVYLSTDTDINNSDDIKIDDWVITGGPYTYFTAGTSKNSGTRTVNVSHVETGGYYLGVKADAENNITESDDFNNTDYDDSPIVSITTKPDLVITSFRIDEMKKNSHEIITTFTIKNQGDIQIDCTQPRLSIAAYLSEDQNIDKDSDYFFDENYDDPNLSPGESKEISERFYGPDNIIPQGNYWFGIHLDFTENYSEKDENNNTDVASNSQVTITAKPDLTWQESSGIEYIEDGITLKYYIIENIGWCEVTEPFGNRFLLSENKILDGNDHEIAHFTHNTELGMMRLTNYNTSASTHDVPAGKYYLIMQTDYEQGVTELSEDNNIWITDEQADIVHLNLSYPNGGEVWVKDKTYTVHWNTEGTVSNITLELHKGDEFLSLITQDEINNGSFEVTIPASIEDGNDYKFYILESGTHYRTHDFSNDYFTIQTTAPVNPQPDLMVQSVEVLDSQGPKICYQGTIKNQGNASAGQSTAKFYLSSDNQISSSDYHIHSWSLTGSLNTGNSKNSGEITTTVSGVPAGEYFLGCIADADNQVSETSENNNKGYDSSPQVTIPESSGGHWADVDGDGDVDAIDIQLVAACWNTQVGDAGYKAECDVDNDGDVDAIDIQLVAGWWNKDISGN